MAMFKGDQDITCTGCGGNKWEATMTPTDAVFLTCQNPTCLGGLAAVRASLDDRWVLRVDRQYADKHATTLLSS